MPTKLKISEAYRPIKGKDYRPAGVKDIDPLQGTGMNVKSIHPDQLQAHPKNVRVHPEENIQAIMKSLQKFGQRTPIVVWTNPELTNEAPYILKGNGTHEAIKRLGWDRIYYVDASHLPTGEAEAYAIADNKTGDMSHFDFSKLAEVMRNLDGQKIDLESTGFRKFELEPLMQATFNAGPAGELPGAGENGIDHSGKTLKFSQEQYEIIRACLQDIRERETEFDVSNESAAITALCYRLSEQKFTWNCNVPF